jgi:hypothetical protein
LASREPDVIALQEVTRRTLPIWQSAFQLMGLVHVRASLDHADRSRTPPTRRFTGVMLASRTAFREVRDPIAVPWPETALCAAAETSRGPVEVWGLHVPNAANGLVKIKTLQAIRHSLATAQPAPRVLVRRSQYAPTRTAHRRGDLVRTRPAQTLASRTRRRMGRRRTSRRPRAAATRIPRCLPCRTQVRQTGAELDLETHRRTRRRMAHRPHIRLHRAAPDRMSLPPRLARPTPKGPSGLEADLALPPGS